MHKGTQRVRQGCTKVHKGAQRVCRDAQRCTKVHRGYAGMHNGVQRWHAQVPGTGIVEAGTTGTILEPVT